MNKINIGGLYIDNVNKPELLKTISGRLQSGQKTFIITPYSEFLYASMRDKEILQLFNSADISVPDGVGIFWAHKFLSVPFSVKNYYTKIFQAFWQVVYTGAAILLRPSFIYSRGENNLHEKIPGSELVWDIAGLAEASHQSIYLLGGFGNIPKLAAEKLVSRYPKLQIAGYSSKDAGNESIIQDIQNSKPDILLVAFGPIKQEQWIKNNMDQLPAKLYIGLGGTFDYLAGTKKQPPKFIRSIGLEWLWRLVTQPSRVKRIFEATVGLITALMRYKISLSMPYRKNVVCAILNGNNEILVAKRNSLDKSGKRMDYFVNYWQFPQGGIDGSEETVDAAKREAWEEVSIQNQNLEFIKTSGETFSYLWANGRRPLWNNVQRYKGQTQSIVYFKFIGNDNEIKVDNQEFTEWKWAPIEQLNIIVHPERMPLAKIIQKDLKNNHH